jgi:DNA-binding LacI/PurR family transcriptional regulator
MTAAIQGIMKAASLRTIATAGGWSPIISWSPDVSIPCSSPPARRPRASFANAAKPTIAVDAAGPREAQGRAAVARLLADATPCDAIFAASDLIAIGVIAALTEAGKRVPQDVAVIGFDGIDSGRYCTPSLSTVEQDLPAAGRLLVNRLLANLGGDTMDGSKVPVRLVVRDSGG